MKKGYNKKAYYNFDNNYYSNYKRDDKSDKKINKRHKRINRIIFILTIILLILLLKFFNVPVVNTAFAKANQFLASDFFSLAKAKDSVVTFIDDSVAKITGDDTKSVLNQNETLSIIMPVSGEVVTNFEDSTHPVFNTTVKARGIEISATKGSEVKSAIKGEITNIIASSYGGSRVVVDVGNNTTIVYDGVRNSFVKEEEKIDKGSVIGLMGEDEENNIIGFEVWINNEAKNPLDYISDEK